MENPVRTTTEHLVPDFSHAGSDGLSAALLRAVGVMIRAQPVPAAARLVRWPSAAADMDALIGALDATASRQGLWVPFDDRSLLVVDADPKRGSIGALEQWIARIPGADRPRVLTVGSVDADGLDVSVRIEEVRAPARPEKLVLADPDRVFMPLWDLQVNAAHCYLCRSRWVGRQGATITEQMLDDYPVSADLLLAVDLEGAEFVSTTLLELLDAYGTANLAIPVHASMLPHAGERWCQEVWGSILPVLDQVTFEVLLSGEGEALEHLDEAVATLAEFGRPLFLRMPPEPELLRRCDPAAFSAIGFDGGYHGAAMQDRDLLGAFADAVSQVGVAPYVLGLSSIDDTLNATNAGFRLIGSDLISAPLRPEPGDHVTEDPAALLRSLIASRATGRG